ncbi:hypothetical protein ACFTRD_32525, partial [Paenibacillus sp. NPDC056933]|uniref:hypothetical protein n=1 Tax=Paenibacillus sp. NPDC056933 TaxID=3345968 RepID=UPI00363CA219
ADTTGSNTGTGKKSSEGEGTNSSSTNKKENQTPNSHNQWKQDSSKKTGKGKKGGQAANKSKDPLTPQESQKDKDTNESKKETNQKPNESDEKNRSNESTKNKLTDAEFDDLVVVLKSQNLSRVMIKELREGIANNKFSVEKIADGRTVYKISVLDLNGKETTTVLLDKFGNTVKMIWTVGTKGKRGSGYSRTKVSPGTERGHIKSVNEGALDNAVEDSPLNIIPQTRQVNDPKIKAFETYRVKEGQGQLVITDILDNPMGYVRVRMPDKKIDVVYNPFSTNAKTWPKEWYKQPGPFH